MPRAPESEHLVTFEQGVDRDAPFLIAFISSWEGFDWFWQLIVFVTYAEQVELRDRLEKALSALAKSSSPQSSARLAEQLISKVQVVTELTHEELLYQEVQRLALILIPTGQVGTT